MESLSNNDDKTNSSKNVRFYELATVFEEERLSTKSSDYESDEGVDTASYSELDWTRAKDSGSNGGIAQARVADVDHVARVVVDEQHHGSPFDVVCKIVEGIYARGIGLTDVSPHGPAQFEVDTTTAPGRPLLVSITGPSGYGVDCDVTGAEQGVHTVTYTPEGPGVHTIEVLYDGVHIASSPYTVHVKKPRVYIRDLSVYAQVGQRSLFKIDASEMQKGTLEIDSDLPVISTEKLGQNTYMVAFIPKTIGHHDLVIKYNNEEVEGSPFDTGGKVDGSVVGK